MEDQQQSYLKGIHIFLVALVAGATVQSVLGKELSWVYCVVCVCFALTFLMSEPTGTKYHP